MWFNDIHDLAEAMYDVFHEVLYTRDIRAEGFLAPDRSGGYEISVLVFTPYPYFQKDPKGASFEDASALPNRAEISLAVYPQLVRYFRVSIGEEPSKEYVLTSTHVYFRGFAESTRKYYTQKYIYDFRLTWDPVE